MAFFSRKHGPEVYNNPTHGNIQTTCFCCKEPILKRELRYNSSKSMFKICPECYKEYCVQYAKAKVGDRVGIMLLKRYQG